MENDFWTPIFKLEGGDERFAIPVSDTRCDTKEQADEVGAKVTKDALSLRFVESKQYSELLFAGTGTIGASEDDNERIDVFLVTDDPAQVDPLFAALRELADMLA